MSKKLVRRVHGLVNRLLSNGDASVAEPTLDGMSVATQPISTIRPREMAHLSGEIVSVTASPPGQPPDCQVDVFDGTGHVRLIWMGRHRIPGVEVGTVIRVSGRATTGNQHLVIYNPVYAIEARQED